ncbi:hypothetical protein [Polaribacter butkevichii]|uniref:Uncharacterized protein n=1 Tax=Polaribacter butkevichii TaxID=218490 RepID=A0A2P6CDM1_9FLAO|nr:hypothetical protein [Polaribacter butkevichii]PQJ73009.1 hypothetical protein BTO14_06955 [Polaribacter butkevichii]
MKNIGLALLLLFFSFNIYSQDKKTKNALFELQKKKVSINIDKDIFTNVYQNMYVSKKPEALVLAVIIPISYDAQKEKVNNKAIKKEIPFKGEKKLNKENVLVFSGTIIKKGIEFAKHIYYIKQQQNTCIELTTMLAVNAPTKDKNMIKAIVNSVIEKN